MSDHDDPLDDARTRAEKLVASVAEGQQLSAARREALVEALIRDFGVADDLDGAQVELVDTPPQVVAQAALRLGPLRLGPSMSFHSYVTGHQVFDLPAGQQAHITRNENLRWRLQHWVGTTATAESGTHESPAAALAALQGMVQPAPMPIADERPVAGDLVVREIQMPAAGGSDSWVAFIVAVHPARGGKTVHRTSESAVLFARAVAAKRGSGLRVWRELPGRDNAYEKLTEG